MSVITGKTITLERECAARSMLLSGLTCQDVAVELHMGRGVVKMLREGIGLLGRQPPPLTPTNPRKGETIALARVLKSAYQAAKQTGIPHATVSGWCREVVPESERGKWRANYLKTRKRPLMFAPPVKVVRKPKPPSRVDLIRQRVLARRAG